MYSSIINKFFPEVEIKSIKTITSGWESDVLVVNDDLVFKFPKVNGRFDCAYEKEKIITDTIRPYISTNISKIQVYDNEGTKFSVLKLIRGEDLNRNNIDIVGDFTNFLKELHSVNIDIFKKYNLNADNLQFYRFRLGLNNFSFNYDTLSDILKKYKMEDDFNKSLHIFTNFNFKEEDDVLCHDDLHKGNVLIDKEGKLNDIIDFGDAVHTNYNIEFVSILKWRKKIVVDIIQKYQEITNRKLNIEFINSIVKLAVYSKISHNTGEIKEYLKKLEFYNTVERLFMDENSSSFEKNKKKVIDLCKD